MDLTSRDALVLTLFLRLKFTKKGFYHWKGFLLLKKLSEREEGLESTCQFLDLPRQAAICVEHIPYLL
jgi:hypothetical protein